MTATAYTPRAGSIPGRAIEILKAAGPGAEMASGPLADALDVDQYSLSAVLEYPLRHGLLAKRRQGNVNYWSLGDDTTLAARDAGDDFDDEDTAPLHPVPPPPPRVKRDPLVSLLTIPAAVSTLRVPPEPAAPGAPAVPSGPGWQPPAEFDRVGKPAEAPALAPSRAMITPREGAEAAHAPTSTSGRGGATPNDGTSPQGLRLALWSDGQLVIQRDGQALTFSADETRAILRYLERMAESEAE